MNIRIAAEKDRQKWDDYIINYPNSSPYHLFGWGMAVKEAYKHECFYLLAEEREEVVGVLPLIYIKPPFLTGELVSLPFCDLGSILTDDDAVEALLISEALLFGKKLNAGYVELREKFIKHKKNESQYQITSLTEKVQMVLALPDSSESLMSGFKSKLRSQIKKAEKNGLNFDWLNIKDLDTFYEVFSINMKELGSPVHSKRWFLELLKAMGDSARIGIVSFGKIPVGAGFILCHGKRVSIPWASTQRKYNYLSPNMLLYWNVLKFAADNGYEEFDFGRSTPGEGTYKFKAQWGAKPCQLNWKYIHLIYKKNSESSGSRKYREIIEKVWQKMPLSLANIIGPAVRKYISL